MNDVMHVGTRTSEGIYVCEHAIGEEKYNLYVSNSGELLTWCTDKELMTTLPVRTPIDDGLTSTRIILEDESSILISSVKYAKHPFPAAEYCRTHTRFGHNDWYLPSLNELVAAYNAGVFQKEYLPYLDYVWTSNLVMGNPLKFSASSGSVVPVNCRLHKSEAACSVPIPTDPS